MWFSNNFKYSIGTYVSDKLLSCKFLRLTLLFGLKISCVI